jgi:hypothetical protein
MVSVKTSCRPVCWKLAGRNGHSSGERNSSQPAPHANTTPHKRNPPPPPPLGGSGIKIFVYYDCTITVCLTVCVRSVFITTRFKATAFYTHVALCIICVLVGRSLTQLSQSGCHRCLCDAHVKAAVIHTARDRYQQLSLTARRLALSRDGRARSGRTMNHHVVGVLTALPSRDSVAGEVGVSVKRG